MWDANVAGRGDKAVGALVALQVVPREVVQRVAGAVLVQQRGHALHVVGWVSWYAAPARAPAYIIRCVRHNKSHIRISGLLTEPTTHNVGVDVAVAMLNRQIECATRPRNREAADEACAFVRPRASNACTDAGVLSLRV